MRMMKKDINFAHVIQKPGVDIKERKIILENSAYKTKINLPTDVKSVK